MSEEREPLGEEALAEMAEEIGYRERRFAASPAEGFTRDAELQWMTTHASRLLAEVGRQRERIRALEGLLDRTVAYVGDGGWSEERAALLAETIEAVHREALERGSDKPKVVCLCGSTRFEDAYVRENRRLTLEGNIVLSVGLFAGSGDVVSDEQKRALDELHLRKIDLADEVRVVGDGYVGESTKKEIEYAKEWCKPVVFCCGEAARSGEKGGSE